MSKLSLIFKIVADSQMKKLKRNHDHLNINITFFTFALFYVN